MGELVVRLVFSLAVVVGLLILLSRVVGRRFGGGPRSLVTVLHRQALSRSTAVAVVSVGSRVLVLGTTEHQVSLLAELSADEARAVRPAADPGRTPEVVEGLEAFEAFGAFGAFAPSDADEPVAPDGDFERELEHAFTSPARTEPPATVGSTRLSGSLLAPQTWRDALTAAKGRTR